MHILAFGVTGFVGGHVVPLLLEHGHHVTVAARSGKFTATTPHDRLAVIQADPTTPGPWQERVRNVDAVLNLAGTPITTRWNAEGKRRILQSRTASTRHIVDALRAAPPGKTLLCANAVGYYGDAGDVSCADDAPRGSGFLADVAAAWQDEALRAQEHGHRVLLPRISVVLGAGGALAKMYRPFSLGLGGKLGSGRQWFPWVHVQDLARAMVFLLEHPNATGVFNVCAPQQVTNAEFTRKLAKTLHRPALFSVPALVLKLAMGEAAEMLLGGQRCVARNLLDLNFAFAYPALDTALTDILPRLRQSGAR